MAYTTKQKEHHRKKLADCINTLIRNISLKPQKMNTERFQKLFWSEEEYELVQRAQALVSRSSIDRCSMTMMVTIKVKHPLITEELECNIDFEVSPSTRQMFWPKDLGRLMDGTDDAELTGILQEVVEHGINKGILSEVLYFLRDKCSHEQARFLAPFYQIILQRAGLSEIARDVEVLKRVPKLPEMPTGMRQKIKHAILLFTIHEMLGTFDMHGSDRDGGDANHVTIELLKTQWHRNAYVDYGDVRIEK